jgi:hypothetical protein
MKFKEWISKVESGQPLPSDYSGLEVEIAESLASKYGSMGSVLKSYIRQGFFSRMKDDDRPIYFSADELGDVQRGLMLYTRKEKPRGEISEGARLRSILRLPSGRNISVDASVDDILKGGKLKRKKEKIGLTTQSDESSSEAYTGGGEGAEAYAGRTGWDEPHPMTYEEYFY